MARRPHRAPVTCGVFLPRGSWLPLDELLMRAVPGDTVGFANIDEFKGLENDTVMAADLLEPRFSERDPVSRVVAMARPRSVLACVLECPSDCSRS